MMKLINILPSFSDELEALLVAKGRSDIGAQIKDAEIDYYTYDESVEAISIYLHPNKPLNVVETNIIGVKHGESIPLDHKYYVVVDTDNFGNLQSIELLFGQEVAAILSGVVAPNSPY